MSKTDKPNKRKGTGFGIGLIIGVLFAVITGNNGLFTLGIAIGAALEAKNNI